ncbi:MAG: hybrid sensor histidine kinase/response regulator [Planctomycetaceae bacterium]
MSPAALLDALPDALLVHREDGRILWANAAAEALFLGGETRLVGSDLNAWTETETPMAEGDADGTRRVRILFRAPSGRRFPAVVARATLEFEGAPALLSIAREEEGRVPAAAESARLAAVVEQAAEGVLITDAAGVTVYANPALERIRGLPKEELLGAPLELIDARDAVSAPFVQVVAALRSGAAWRGRIQGRRGDGKAYVSEASLFPVRDAAGTIENFVLLERDVTREHDLEAALRQAQKMEAIGNLAGGLAHDFNNLLTAILGYSNLLRRTLPAGSEAREMAQLIESSAQRAGDLTRQLLGFARRGKDRDLPVDLHLLVRSLCRMLRATFDKAISIREHLAAEHAVVQGDPLQLEQALLNLALNARDAMEGRRGAELAFSTEVRVLDEASCATHPGASPGLFLVLSVTDNGRGIPPAIRGRIFEPLFTTKPPGEGSGMGLSMVYGIVKNHGGCIRVASEVDRGTTMALYLPLVASDAPFEPDPIETLVRGTGRILIVDDEEVVRQAAAVLLRHLGYEVLTASDGVEAVERFRSDPGAVDLVLLDLVMPRMGGRECFRALKEIDPQVRAVLATGYGRSEAAQIVRDDGIQGLVQKPYVAAQLGQAVAAALPKTGRGAGAVRG